MSSAAYSALPGVDVVIVTYSADSSRLESCLDGVRAASSATTVSIVVVDTGSRSAAGRLQGWATSNAIALIELPANPGFAAAVNAGVATGGHPFVMVLNDDVVLPEHAFARLVGAAETDSTLAGVSPVLRLAATDRVDAAGIVVRPSGDVWNRRHGQSLTSLGSGLVPVQGLCFAAALLKRCALEDAVGQLEESFFMYWEDAEWCVRAAMSGWRFAVDNDTVATHEHSATTGSWPFSRKYRLVERNMMWAAMRSLPAPFARRLVLARSWQHIRGLLTGPHRSDRLAILSAAWFGLPRMLRIRRRAKRASISSEAVAAFFEKSRNEPLPIAL